MAHRLRKIKVIATPPKDDIYRKSDRRNRIIENGINIDYTVFEKTPEERLILKLAKVMAKRGIEYERKSYKRSKAQRIAYRQKQLRLLSEAQGNHPIISPEIEP